MAGKECLLSGHAVAALHGDTRVESLHGVDEPERRAVRQEGDERVGIDPHRLRFLRSPLPATRRYMPFS
jgi:hypothetical protein